MKKISVILWLFVFPFMGISQTQNTLTEVIDYREVDGKIVVNMVVNGVMADFVLDLSGHNAVLPEYLGKLNIDPNVEGNFGYAEFQYKKVPVKKVLKINTLSLGNGAFAEDMPVFVLEDSPYLRKLGVVGVIGSTFFKETVLTIDARRKKITLTVPYRPSYMKLNYRENIDLIRGNGIVCNATLDNQIYDILVDTWTDATIAMNEEDFKNLSAPLGQSVPVGEGYGENTLRTRTKEVKNVHFVKTDLGKVNVVEDKTLSRTVLGRGILQYGILSIDYVRHKIYFQPHDLVELKDETIPEVKIEAGRLNPITRDYFLKHIFDYRENKDFIYKGDKPVVIDFWASWCGPCMRLLPEMEKMADKYKDQVIFLKVNADKEKELCNIFNINALPTLFFIPVNGKPIVEVGAKPEQFISIIEEKLLKTNE